MSFPKQGQDADAILNHLQSLKQDDVPWKEGHVFAYVYDAGDDAMDLVHKAYSMYLTENGLDPTSFPSLLELEKEVVGMAADLVNAGPEAKGSFTSGGTESILLAVKTARDYFRETKPEIRDPELLLPETAHAAFFKACAYFDVKPVTVAVNPDSFAADPKAMAAAVTPNTIMMVASAPSYAHGVVDPIAELAPIALEHNILFHVDCCVGGFSLPFAKKLGYDIPEFDFSVPGVTSISMDIHKFGYAAKGASIILYNNGDLRRHQIFACSSWSGYTVINPTVMSTKSGGPIAGAWAVLNYLGEEGYMKLVDGSMQAALKLRKGIENIDGLRLLGNPATSLFCMTSDDFDIFPLADDMKARGWYIQPQFAYANSPENIHFTVGAANVPHVDALLKDLKECVEIQRAKQTGKTQMQLPDDLMDMLENLTPEVFDQLSALLGANGEDLPARMDEINNLLNGLPAHIREKILTEYVHRLYSPA